MKKSKKAALIVSAVLIVLGGVLYAGAAAFTGFDFTVFETSSLTRKEYEVNESFNDISIDAKDCSVQLRYSDDGKCRIVCGENENITHTVEVKDNTLNITRNDSRKWYMMIGVSLKQYDITVYLPEKMYGALLFESGSGDISVPEDFGFSSADILTGSGSVDISAGFDGGFSVKTSSGDIKIKNLSADVIDINTVSGEIDISEVTAAQAINIKSSSGDTELSEANAKDISVQSSSGEIKFYGVKAGGEIRAESRSGDVSLDKSDADSLYIKTNSGDVSGSLLTPKIYNAETGSGTVKLPRSEEGGTCDIVTGSGDIDFD